MGNYFTTPIYKFLVFFFDDSIPEIEIREFLFKCISELNKFPTSHFDIETQNDVNDIKVLSNFIQTDHLEKIAPRTISKECSELELAKWAKELPKQRVIGPKGLIQNSGKMLQCILGNFSQEYNDLLVDNFERLIRHIEVKRKTSLHSRHPNDLTTNWMEKHDITIALCQYTRLTDDLRFLNTAFKLNDWAFKIHKKLPHNPQLIRYLLAVAEAEYTYKVYFPS